MQASSLNAIASLPDSGPTHRRGLKQDSTQQLTQVLTQVGQVKAQQDSIAAQMTKLQQQVDRANALAEARANDNRLIDLIQAGRQDIAAGQARVEAKLDEIIGKQNASLAAAEAATAALNAIQGLAQRQLAAQQALEKAVQNQLTAIKTATYQRIISLSQALALWKRARRDKALTEKAAKLANIPCINVPTADNLFTLDNGNIVDTSTARERNIGLTNRVIGGMLLHQVGPERCSKCMAWAGVPWSQRLWLRGLSQCHLAASLTLIPSRPSLPFSSPPQYRTNDTNCTESKFSKIQQTCTGPVTLKSFGVDPVFKRGTTLYNPDYDDVKGELVLNWWVLGCFDRVDQELGLGSGTLEAGQASALLRLHFRAPPACDAARQVLATVEKPAHASLLHISLTMCLLCPVPLPPCRYNCSLLTSPTYKVQFQNMTTNEAPYCAELYNSQRLPYAFHHFPLKHKESGFPVFFDINLSQVRILASAGTRHSQPDPVKIT